MPRDEIAKHGICGEVAACSAEQGCEWFWFEKMEVRG